MARRVVFVVLLLAALVSVATTLGIVVSLFVPPAEFFQEVPITDFLIGTTWTPTFANPRVRRAAPGRRARVLTTIIASIVALPLGLGSAIYLSEYADDRVRRRTQAGAGGARRHPHGHLRLLRAHVVTPFLRWLFPGDAELPTIFNALSAGLVMGVMIIPTIASLSEDAMSAVPNGLRQGAFALGSNKRQVSTRVVVPAALSGITAAFVLGISRAIGETMIVDHGRLAAAEHLVEPAGDPPDDDGIHRRAPRAETSRPAPRSTRRSLPSVRCCSSFTFVMNMISIRLVRKYREVYE